ncbi:MAG TPA: hypothetical protein VK178_02970 [Opitutaceae bacterium]|nr:hypothetical protein [Opitutaceae bacterium]
MRTYRTLILVSAACLGLGATRAFGAFTLFTRVWGNAIVATDVTEAGKAATPPTPLNPVYYVGRSLGCRLGSLRGENLPDEKEMHRIITNVLAKQGYVGTRPELREPSILLMVQWGYLDSRSEDLLWFLGYDSRQDPMARVDPKYTGSERFRTRPREIETIMDYASDSMYGIIVTAFDYKSVGTGNPVIYWQSRIGLPANGKSMAQAIPSMIIAAGPALGRESKLPVLADADNAREGHVEYREPEFIGYKEDLEKKE